MDNMNALAFEKLLSQPQLDVWEKCSSHAALQKRQSDDSGRIMVEQRGRGFKAERAKRDADQEWVRVDADGR